MSRSRVHDRWQQSDRIENLFNKMCHKCQEKFWEKFFVQLRNICGAYPFQYAFIQFVSGETETSLRFRVTWGKKYGIDWLNDLSREEIIFHDP